MTAGIFTVRDGRIRVDVAAPPGIADGTDVVVEFSPRRIELNGMTESEWYDTPEAAAAWIAEAEATPALEFTPEEQAAYDDWERWRTETKAYNIECMRREFAKPNLFDVAEQ